MHTYVYRLTTIRAYAFLIYINDISNSSCLMLFSFADDTTIYQSDNYIDNLSTTVNQ